MSHIHKLLERLKCEFKNETIEEGVGVGSLAHNTLRVKGACQSSGMGIKMSEKWVNYSYETTQTK
jgi:hypothetical protein